MYALGVEVCQISGGRRFDMQARAPVVPVYGICELYYRL